MIDFLSEASFFLIVGCAFIFIVGCLIFSLYLLGNYLTCRYKTRLQANRNETYSISFRMIFNQPTHQQPIVGFTTQRTPLWYNEESIPLANQLKEWVKSTLKDNYPHFFFPIIIDEKLHK